jgi:hypothetical protein
VHSCFEGTEYSFAAADTSVIAGHEEALYDFMAVAVAMEQFDMGVLDMGGASKQLSYVLDPAVLAEEGAGAGDGDGDGDGNLCLPDYELRLPGSGSAAPTGLVARSIEGLGLLAAMDFIVDLHVTLDEDGAAVMHSQPCLAVGNTAKGMSAYCIQYCAPLSFYSCQ